VSADVLSLRQLNRATLERQLLLRRHDMAPLDAVEYLVGLQAQVPLNPYTALWSRLEGFDPEELGRLMEERAVVRIACMRSTIHMVTADDALGLWPLATPVLDRELRMHPEYSLLVPDIDVPALLAVARPLLDEPRTLPELRRLLGERFPGHDPGVLAFLCRNRLGVVQVPPRGVWGKAAQVNVASAEAWLGRPMAEASIDAVVLRYLAAFGPAMVADVATWSGLTAMREVVDRLRPQLREFTDERGRPYVDLPDAPRPDPDTPAPARFLPEYDNALLSHADRSRFLSDDDRKALAAGPSARGSLLVGGNCVGTWRLDEDRKAGTAVVEAYVLRALSPGDAEEVEDEGTRLLAFLAPKAASTDLRVTVAG
jgi:DNA glycosylase AlkZ-like